MQKNRLVCKAVLATLVLIQASLLAYLSWSTGPNRTEVGHIGAAVYLWHTGKLDVFHVNPPFVRATASTPIALFCKPHYDWTGYSPPFGRLFRLPLCLGTVWSRHSAEIVLPNGIAIRLTDASPRSIAELVHAIAPSC